MLEKKQMCLKLKYTIAFCLSKVMIGLFIYFSFIQLKAAIQLNHEYSKQQCALFEKQNQTDYR